MQMLGTLFLKTMAVFQTELTIWGITITYWQVFVFTIVAGVICRILGEIFLGD